MEYITESAEETKSFGRKLSADLAPGDVLALSGDLGSGKTTLIQGIAEGLGIKGRINSPTFIIMRQYDYFYHVDLYRLEEHLEEELDNLGLTDIIKEGKSIVVIEWAERIKDLLPEHTKRIMIKNINEDERKITVL